jgi:hypothetical protein
MTSSTTATSGAGEGANWLKIHVLEGDGVVPHLFQYLYRLDRTLRGRHHAFAASPGPSTGNGNGASKSEGAPTSPSPTATQSGGGNATNTVTGQSTSYAPTPLQSTLGYALPIPDTVIFDHNFPQAWFRYRDKEIVKRPGRYLDAQHVYKCFSRIEPNSGGICAQFACAVPDPEDPSITRTKVYYLNPPDLECLLYSRGAMATIVKHGILQKFVPPRGSCNDMIEVVWSPKLTICRRRVNRFSLSSRSVTLDEKAATFDGAPHLSLESAANDRVSKQLTEMMANVAEHLLRHEHKNVSRISALFKQDRYCQPWLHFATSIRVESDHLIGGSVHRLPVNLCPKYVHPSTEVSDDYIEKQTKRKVILDFREKPYVPFVPRTPRYRFTASALIRGPLTARDPKYEKFLKLKEKYLSEDTGSLSGGAGGASSVAPEVRALQNFVDDTFYTVYAARMTVSTKPTPAIVTVPTQIESLLGPSRLEQLMVGILNMKRDRTSEQLQQRHLSVVSASTLQAKASRSPSVAGNLQSVEPSTPVQQVTSNEDEEAAGDETARTVTPAPPSGTRTPSSVHLHHRGSVATSASSPMRRKGPRIYVSPLESEGHHAVPLRTIRDQCDLFVEEFKASLS